MRRRSAVKKGTILIALLFTPNHQMQVEGHVSCVRENRKLIFYTHVYVFDKGEDDGKISSHQL